MRTTWKQFTGIARLTALEAARQPVFLLLTTLVLVFIALLPFLITHVISDSARMVRDSALAIQWVSGLILGSYAATATITRELRKGTLASIVSKPVGRGVYFIAKFTGVASVMLVYAGITTLTILLSVRTAAEPYVYDWWGVGPLLVALALAYVGSAAHNFFFQVPFVSRAYAFVVLAVVIAFLISCWVPEAGVASGFGTAMAWNVLPAGLLIGMAMLLFSALAVSLAAHLDMIPALSVCLVIFLLGLMSDYLLGQRADANGFFSLAYSLIPNGQHFWTVDLLPRGNIPWTYTAEVALYTTAHAAAILAAGLLAFNRMEVK